MISDGGRGNVSPEGQRGTGGATENNPNKSDDDGKEDIAPEGHKHTIFGATELGGALPVEIPLLSEPFYRIFH